MLLLVSSCWTIPTSDSCRYWSHLAFLIPSAYISPVAVTTGVNHHTRLTVLGLGMEVIRGRALT
jgi:hypothetical protein